MASNASETLLKQNNSDTSSISYRSSDTVIAENAKNSARKKFKPPGEVPSKPPRGVRADPSSGNVTLRSKNQALLSDTPGRSESGAVSASASASGLTSTSASASASVSASASSSSGKSQTKGSRSEKNSRRMSSPGHSSRNASKSGGNKYAKLVLAPDPASHPFKIRNIWIEPNGSCKVGRVVGKPRPSESNAIFDCKVLSRTHAIITYGEGKFKIQDMNSSNGTFINGENIMHEMVELRFDDVVRFGVDVREHSKDEVHNCIKARVELYSPDGQPIIDKNAISSPKSMNEVCLSSDDLRKINNIVDQASARSDACEDELAKVREQLNLSKDEPGAAWEAVLARDEAIQHIMNLERKVKILEGEQTEEELKNTVKTLNDEKLSYEKEAEEAINRIKLENSETAFKINEIEAQLRSSESSNTDLRSTFVGLEIALSDATEQLRLLEMEYAENRIKADEIREQTRQEYEQHISELNKRIKEQEDAYSALRAEVDCVVKKASEDTMNAIRKRPKSVKKPKGESGAIKKAAADKRGKSKNTCTTLVRVGNKSKVGKWDPESIVGKLCNVEDCLAQLQKDINEISNAIDNSFISEKDAAWIIEKMQIQHPILLESYKSVVDSFQSLIIERDSDDDCSESNAIIHLDKLNHDDLGLARALQAQIRELRICLFFKNQDLKVSCQHLITKRDMYKEKVAELARASEANITEIGEEKLHEQDMSHKASTSASGDHVSCDSGVGNPRRISRSQLDKSTETDTPTKVDFSSATLDDYSDDDDCDALSVQARNEQLRHELALVRETANDREIQVRNYRTQLICIDDENEKLRKEVYDLQKELSSNGNWIIYTIIGIIFVVLAFVAMDFFLFN